MLVWVGCADHKRQRENYIATGPRLTNGLPVVRISTFKDGQVLLDGKSASLAEIEAAVARCRAGTGVVWWYNEPRQEGEPKPPLWDGVFKAIYERCEIRLSGSTNFADLIEEQRRTRLLLDRLNNEAQ